MKMTPAVIGLLLSLSTSPLWAQTTHRLYDGVTAFINNPDGNGFMLSFDLRDINHLSMGPAELLLKVYDPDGRVLVREVIPDDGVVSNTYQPPVAGWDHEAWYYSTSYSRGIEPMIRWSSFSDPRRLASWTKRSFMRKVKGGKKGVYRAVIVGVPDHFLTLKLDPPLKYGVSGSPEWLHGHGDMYRKSFIYVPKVASGISLLFIQFDRPAKRTFTLSTLKGKVLATGNGEDGLVRKTVNFETPGQYDDQLFVLKVSDGSGDFLVNATIHPIREQKHWRGSLALTAVLAPDQATAKALRGGVIYHDGQSFWQMYQVRMYEWLKTVKPKDSTLPTGLLVRKGYVSVGSHNSPKAGSADRIMHSYELHKNPKALNGALKEIFQGLMQIGPGDHVAIGPLRNLAYEMGCYSFFYHRPAWRILQQTDAPPEAKGPIREFVIQIGDRLAFCRGNEFVNGNAMASLVQALRYCYEASGDPLQKELFETYLERFSTGGFGDRIGIGPSGGCQESFGYDHHYGSYILRGWKAVLTDLKDERIQKLYDGILSLYSYTAAQGDNAAPWSSRTHQKPAGGGYNAWHPRFRWKGLGGPDLTTGVNGHNEWFAARRRNYYMVTYHGRLTPTWMGEGFHGQVGYGGGIICQLHIPGKGQVLASTVHGSYGAGMHISQWRNFHLHSLVGTTSDGKPLVTANSEHFNAKLEGNLLTSSAEVRESSVRVARSYNFGSDSIVCGVQLSESIADTVYKLWGGAHGLRAHLTEGYEMIPFTNLKPNRKTGKLPEGATKVIGVNASGKEIGELDTQPKLASAVLIERPGYGARIELDRQRPVMLGKNNTLLIQLVNKRTHANEVALEYRIVPYIGEPPIGGMMGTKKDEFLARLDGIDSVEKVASILASQEARQVKQKGQTLAELRFAIAGVQLALHAKISDPNVSPHAAPWKGSCIEVFGSMPGGSRIGQVFLSPQSGDTPAKAYIAKGDKQEATKQIRIQTNKTGSGYELKALIPTELLAWDITKEKFLLEFQVTTMAKAKKSKAVRGTLFRSSLAYLDNSRYGVFVLKKKEMQEDK